MIADHVTRADTALGELEMLPDSRARSAAIEAVQALLELYGEGLARMVGASARLGGEAVLTAFSEDDLVAHLLILHGLHPSDLEARIALALEEVRPYLQSHGGDVEIVAVEGNVARVRLRGSCQGCPSSAATMQDAIERAVYRTAPEIVRIEAVESAPQLRAGFIPLSAIG